MKLSHLLFLLCCVLFLRSSSQNKPSSPSSVTVYIFLSETCPICQNYTLTLKELNLKYSRSGVKFIGVFPNYYSDEKSLHDFKKKYTIPFELILDKKAAFTKRLKAVTTPETFIEDDHGNVLYSGRIDDSFYALGKRRTVVTSNDLENALKEITSGKKVTQPKTQAVGCIITSSK